MKNIDLTNSEFINGIAIATKEIIKNNHSYKYYGLIDNNFNEVLAFMNTNLKISRYGANDFILERLIDNIVPTLEYEHIRIKDKKIVFKNILISGEKPILTGTNYVENTNHDKLVIIGNDYQKYLYDLESCRQITPFLNTIKQSQYDNDLFDVILQTGSNKSYIDRLYFKIDKDGNIVSQILSYLNNDYLSYNYFSIEKLIKDRETELNLKYQDFEEKRKFVEQSRYLKRIKKN